MIFKSISKTGSLTFYFLCMDIGNNSEGLAMQNFQIPDTDETRTNSKWLFPPRFSNKNRCTPPAVRMLYWLPSLRKKSNRLAMRGGVLRSGRGGEPAGDQEHFYSNASH